MSGDRTNAVIRGTFVEPLTRLVPHWSGYLLGACPTAAPTERGVLRLTGDDA